MLTLLKFIRISYVHTRTHTSSLELWFYSAKSFTVSLPATEELLTM